MLNENNISFIYNIVHFYKNLLKQKKDKKFTHKAPKTVHITTKTKLLYKSDAIPLLLL